MKKMIFFVRCLLETMSHAEQMRRINQVIQECMPYCDSEKDFLRFAKSRNHFPELLYYGDFTYVYQSIQMERLLREQQAEEQRKPKSKKQNKRAKIAARRAAKWK